MNKWVGIGRLTRDPELRRTGTGIAVASFTVAIDDGYGEKKTTDFVDIVAWGTLGENCSKYLRKGAKVAVSGKLKKRSYEKEGRKVWITEIKADEVEFLESKHSTAEQDPAGAGYGVPEHPGDYAVIDDDDAQLPF